MHSFVLIFGGCFPPLLPYLLLLLLRFLATREDCEKVLQKLYEVGKISPHDIEVFEDENKPKWMARVHSLERIADKVSGNRRRGNRSWLASASLESQEISAVALFIRILKCASFSVVEFCCRLLSRALAQILLLFVCVR